jgi:phosphopantothenoylcysteine decarboxylase/phosphopantothenate--cysteine ligase
MATLTIRNLPQEVYDRLRIRAAENKRSMEAEARELMTRGLGPPKLSQEEVLGRVRETMATIPEENQDHFSVDRFLAERRKMWGEDE